MSKLKLEDRHAIDVLLERPDGQGAKSLVEMVFARPVKDQFEERLNAAEKLLGVLDAMPSPEPAEDLVSRTLQRIDQDRIEPSASIAPKFSSLSSDAREQA